MLALSLFAAIKKQKKTKKKTNHDLSALTIRIHSQNKKQFYLLLIVCCGSTNTISFFLSLSN
jgi:hypothetical protein